jgi:hypothetical protein
MLKNALQLFFYLLLSGLAIGLREGSKRYPLWAGFAHKDIAESPTRSFYEGSRPKIKPHSKFLSSNVVPSKTP